MSEDEDRPRRHKDEQTIFGFPRRYVMIVGVGILAAALLLTFFASFSTVDAGYRGVLMNWGQPTATFGEGWNWKFPIGTTVEKMNVQVQKTSAAESSASSDLQEVTTTVALNYQLDERFVLDIYKNFRQEYESRLIIPLLQDGLKATTAKYAAEQLISTRENVKQSLLNIMTEKLAPFHIRVIDVSLTNFEFSPTFTAAIEAKVTAQQAALEAQNKLLQIQYEAQQKVIQAQADANATVTNANANAQKTVINAEADAQKTVLNANATATSIQRINEQLQNSPQYMEYLKTITWNGQLPTYWGGQGNLPFLIIPGTGTNSTSP